MNASNKKERTMKERKGDIETKRRHGKARRERERDRAKFIG